MNTIYSCGIKINPLSVDEFVSSADKWLAEGKKGYQIVGVNLEQFALLSKNAAFKDYLNSSNLVNIDGTIVYLYLKLRGYKLSQKTLCADIFLRMLDNANIRNEKVYFLGAAPNTIEILVQNIHNKYPNLQIVGYHDGYFKDEQAIVRDIASKAPDYLFIGMPSPFKERFITEHKAEMNAGVCFGVGGMFDILAGKAKRAPEFVQKMGIEWLYRITQNPIGHSKRVMRALIPCLTVFCNNLFEARKQTF